MKKKYFKKLEKAFENLKELEKLLDDRIVENNTVGELRKDYTKQATHCYVLYRDKLWKAKYAIRDILNKEGGDFIG